jgi:hypothetical protein
MKEAEIMTGKQYWFVVLMALVGGVAGGFLSSRLFPEETVWAQQRSRVVNSEEFLLVDKAGKTRGGLGLGPDGGVGLILTDKEGTKTLYISPDEPHVLRLSDKSGKTLFAVP